MKRNRVEVPNVTPKERLSLVANVIGFETYARDGRPVRISDEGDPQIVLSDEETTFCLLVAARILEHLEAVER